MMPHPPVLVSWGRDKAGSLQSSVRIPLNLRRHSSQLQPVTEDRSSLGVPVWERRLEVSLQEPDDWDKGRSAQGPGVFSA